MVDSLRAGLSTGQRLFYEDGVFFRAPILPEPVPGGGPERAEIIAAIPSGVTAIKRCALLEKCYKLAARFLLPTAPFRRSTTHHVGAGRRGGRSRERPGGSGTAGLSW